MKLWTHYHTPRSIHEALALLAQYEGRARIVAGGTDLILELQQGHHPPVEALIDVTRIAEMAAIQPQGDAVIVGAAVVHTRIVESALLSARATCLVESCGVIGGPQVRNVATLGGNVAHALPAGDGTTSLVALDAEAEVAFGDGRREWLPILRLFVGTGRSLVDATRDVLARFRFRLAGPGEGSAFKRIMRPQGVALPILGCAVWLSLDAAGCVRAARVCLAPVAPTPVRAEAVEAALIGLPVDERAIEKAVRAAQESLHPRTSKYRATAAYRAEMMAVLLRQALPLAARRALTGEATPEGVGLA